jgi:hypothetical protein
MFCCDAAHVTNPVIHGCQLEGNGNRTYAAARSDEQGADKAAVSFDYMNVDQWHAQSLHRNR